MSIYQLNLILWLHGNFFFFSLGQSLQTLPNRRLNNVFLQSHSKTGKTWDVNPAPLIPLWTGLAAAYCGLKSSKPFSSSNKCIHLNEFGCHLFFFLFLPCLSFFSFQIKQICMWSAKFKKKKPHLSNSQAQQRNLINVHTVLLLHL